MQRSGTSETGVRPEIDPSGRFDFASSTIAAMPEMEPSFRVLLVDHRPPDAPPVLRTLQLCREAGFSTVEVCPVPELESLASSDGGCTLLWSLTPVQDTTEALRRFRSVHIEQPIVTLVETGHEAACLESLLAGADEALLTDELTPHALAQAVLRAGARAAFRMAARESWSIEPCQAAHALEARERHAQALLGLSRRLERADSHAGILAAAREAITAVIGMRRVWLYQLSADGEYLHLVLEDEGGDPLQQKGEGRRLHVAGDPMLEEIVAGTDVVVVEDARTDPRTNKEIVEALGNRTLVNVPIVLAGRTLGSLGTGSFGDEGVQQLTVEEREFLAALGSHVAAVLDRVTAAAERDRAEAALRESEARFRQLAEALPHHVWTCGPDGECDYANRQWVDYSGVSAESKLGLGWSDRLHPDDRQGVLAAWQTTVRTRNEFRCELRLRRYDGQYRWFEVRAARIRAADGTTLKWVGSNTDVDENKQSAAERERLARLIEHSRDFIATAGLDGQLNYLNAGGRQLLGLGAEASLSNLSLWNLSPEAERAALEQEVRGALEQSGQWEGELRLLQRQTGTPIDVNISIFVIRDPHTGKPWCLAAMMHDVSAAKRAEHSRKLFRMLVDHSNDALEVIDAETARFVDSNASGYNSLGYTREELLRLTVFDIDPTVNPASWPQRMEAMRRTKRGIVHGVHRRKDGSTFPVEVNVGWVELDKQYLVSVARDVSERKQLEEQVRQSQKMEAVGQLAGGIAHDFNYLLCVISGYADLCLMRLPDGDPGRKMLTDIRAAGEQAARLTRQLLAFSRQQVLAPTVLDLNTVLAEVRNMLQRLIGEDIILSTQLAPDLWPVKVDAGQINQVIVNLAVNARDAMPEGGRLTLETRNVERRMDDPTAPGGIRTQRSVLLCVSDTGSGMGPEVSSRIFEPFFTTKGVGHGTGLGLAVVHGIVQQSEGEIEVETGEGRGTRFRVYLPAVSQPVPLAIEPRDRVPGRGTETIILVEDDDLVRTFAAHALEPFGYTILKARNGDQALQTALAHPGKIHLLVTDVVMPGMNGRMVAEALQAHDPELKVLFLSGYTDDAVMRHGIHQAEVAFLQKPVSPRVLAAKVRELLDLPVTSISPPQSDGQ